MTMPTTNNKYWAEVIHRFQRSILVVRCGHKVIGSLDFYDADNGQEEIKKWVKLVEEMNMQDND